MTVDTIIRGGTIIDGTGKCAYAADIAIDKGRIYAIGELSNARSTTTIDARGKVVVPGFIDVHTHYDGQVSWDDRIEPSSSHGVTTVVMGNCGVGFAPVRKGQEEWLIQLMEGVEDIPGTALHEGIRWNWETFPQYMDVLSERAFAVDVAAQLPHGALRAYVMGERGVADEPATADDIKAMAKLVTEAVEAGAVGFSTSRTFLHQASDGRPVPGTAAADEELLVLAHAMRAGGGAVFEMVPGGLGVVEDKDPWTMEHELRLIARISEETGLSSTFVVGQTHSAPELIYDVLKAADSFLANTPTRLQFSGRPGGVLSALQGVHVLQRRPTMIELSRLPLEEQVARMRDPSVKAKILDEPNTPSATESINEKFDEFLRAHFEVTFPLGDPPDYEPDPAKSIAHIARSTGRDPFDVSYDLLLENDGRAMLIALTTNYVGGNLDIIETLMRHPKTVLGLGDGGAHARYICDASIPTFVLSHWGRDRTKGNRIELETLVRKQTYDPAQLYGFSDRGCLTVGKRADLNVIDFAKLSLGAPYFVDDLPTGARRVLQAAEGYDITMVNGIVTRRNGKDTGRRPGRLYRG